ncbi:Inositol-3-phosphate synthase [Phytophthora palmivora]|uniref:Inositol-3-phosphate synthase n=1 Tax=Phytophthora palmivora TaxID=4796 RepID=A0A2P4WYQ7_9STRA|nr:Inositol-3-phosphate synthase [Phytophthora palmivora]
MVRFLYEGKDAKGDRRSPRQRAQLHRYELADGLLHYRVDPGDPPQVVVPDDEDLKGEGCADEGPHWPREDLPSGLSDIWWSRLYKWVAHYVTTCETCQTVKPSGHASAPLLSLPVPADCWKSMSLDFVFVLPADDKRKPRGVWTTLFQLLGTVLTMSTADHPQTDGLTERVKKRARRYSSQYLC